MRRKPATEDLDVAAAVARAYVRGCTFRLRELQHDEVSVLKRVHVIDEQAGPFSETVFGQILGCSGAGGCHTCASKCALGVERDRLRGQYVEAMWDDAARVRTRRIAAQGVLIDAENGHNHSMVRAWMDTWFGS